MSGKMFKSDPRQSGLSMLTRVQEVKYGKDIGVDTDTAVDYLCRLCLDAGAGFSALFEVNGRWYCPVHGADVQRVHKSRVADYETEYEKELTFRTGDRTMMQEESQQLVVQKVSPLLPSRSEKRNLMKSYLEAGIVNREDYGNYADMAAEFLAIVALVHGLNPMLKEVHTWPIKRKIEGQEVVVGIETSVGVYGYQRQADERARKGDDYSWGVMEVLSKEEKLARGANKCPSCNGSGKFGSSGKCFRCNGTGAFNVDHVLVVKREIYLRRQAQMATEFNLPVIPVTGYGVYRPGDSIPEGRDAMWRAESRATKDAFKKAYALDFWLPSVMDLESRPTGAVMVDEDADLNGDDTHIIEVEATVIEEEPAEWPSHEEPVPEEETQEDTEPAEETQPELITLETLGFGETIPKSQSGVDIQKNAMARLDELGYSKGAPQIGLIRALWGDDVNWASITGGQLFNMLAYARRASGQEKDVKDALKEECKAKTESGEYWT